MSNLNNILQKYFNRACLMPNISHIVAMSIDREIQKEKGDQSHLTFSKDGASPSSNIDMFKKSKELKFKQKLLKNITDKNLSTKAQYIQAFNEAKGIEIDTINLLYANDQIDEKNMWEYFFNKYLISRGGWKIKLLDNKSDNIFDMFAGYEDTQKTTTGPLVTILMPAYNNEKTIYFAVKSILNQTHTNIELIIIDDCSTDKTKEVCEKLKKEDSRVIYIKNSVNSGAYVSRNNGLLIAKGEYITVLDGDDWSFPQRIAFQLQRLKENPEVKVHLGYYLRMNELGSIGAFRITGKFSYDGALHKCLASMFIEKKFLDESLGFWDSVRFGADSEMYYRVLSLNKKLILEDYVPIYLALDRKDSLTNSSATKIGGDLRSRYAKEYVKFHESAKKSELIYIFPNNTRPFDTPAEMQVVLEKRLN